MKINFLFLLLLLIAVVSSCSKDPVDPLFIDNESVKGCVNLNLVVENGMFVFENDADFSRAIFELGTLSLEDRLKLESNLGFFSLQTLCEDLSENLEIVESEDDYVNVKGKYEKFVIWGDTSMEGQAFFIPLDNMKYLPIVNSNCQVKIGGEIKSFYSDGLKKAWYADDLLKNTTLASCKKFRSKDVQLIASFQEVKSGWFDCFKLYISTQKHRRLTGWNNVARVKTIRNLSTSGISFGTFKIIYPPAPFDPYPYLEDEVSVPYNATHKTSDERYTNYHIPKPGRSFKFDFKVWGNGFSESDACRVTFSVN